jgi:hypothetical protein
MVQILVYLGQRSLANKELKTIALFPRGKKKIRLTSTFGSYTKLKIENEVGINLVIQYSIIR